MSADVTTKTGQLVESEHWVRRDPQISPRTDLSTTQGTMSIVSDSTSITLQTALQHDTRFTALEHNIANTSAPGFLAQRVEFEDELSLAMRMATPPPHEQKQ